MAISGSGPIRPEGPEPKPMPQADMEEISSVEDRVNEIGTLMHGLVEAYLSSSAAATQEGHAWDARSIERLPPPNRDELKEKLEKIVAGASQATNSKVAAVVHKGLLRELDDIEAEYPNYNWGEVRRDVESAVQALEGKLQENRETQKEYWKEDSLIAEKEESVEPLPEGFATSALQKRCRESSEYEFIVVSGCVVLKGWAQGVKDLMHFDHKKPPIDPKLDEVAYLEQLIAFLKESGLKNHEIEALSISTFSHIIELSADIAKEKLIERGKIPGSWFKQGGTDHIEMTEGAFNVVLKGNLRAVEIRYEYSLEKNGEKKEYWVSVQITNFANQNPNKVDSLIVIE